MASGSSSERSQYESPEFRQIVACGARGELAVHRRVTVGGLHDPARDRQQQTFVAKAIDGVARDAGIDCIPDTKRLVAEALLDRAETLHATNPNHFYR